MTVRTEAEALLDARGYLEKGLDNIEGFEGPWRSKEVRELMRETLAILADVRPGNALDHEKADLAIRQAFDIEQDAGWDEAIVLAVAALDKCLTLAPADGFTTDERRLVIHGLITLSQQEGVPIKDRDAAAHLAGRVARRPVRVEQTPAPAQVPDRDALIDLLTETGFSTLRARGIAGAILALPTKPDPRIAAVLALCEKYPQRYAEIRAALGVQA